MYDIKRSRFHAMTYVLCVLLAQGAAVGQVQVSGSASYVRSILPGQNLGEERFDLMGIGLDPDDGTRFMVCRTNSLNECPSSDSIHVYRHETSTNQWVFDGSIDHPGVVYESIVDVDGDRVAIGQDFFSGSIGNDSADVYKRGVGGVWTHEGTIRPADNFVGDFFGYSVSLDGDLLAVGAPQEGDDPRASQVGPGSVYVYQFTNGNWIQTDKVIAADGVDRDYFGNEIDIMTTPDGWRMLVAAPDASGDPSGFNMAGAVYHFEKSMGAITQLDKRVGSVDPQVSGDYGDGGVALEDELVAIAGVQRVEFLTINSSGQLVPISSTGLQGTEFSRPHIANRVITVGAPNESTPSIFVMRVPVSGQIESFSVPLPAGLDVLDGFGRVVRTDGEFIATSVSGLDLTGENAGGVWTQPVFGGSAPTGLLTEGGTAPNAMSGAAIAASDEWVAIGAPGELSDCHPDAIGSVRMLRADTSGWVTSALISPESGVVGGGFGRAIAIDGDTMAVAMPEYVGPLFLTPNGAVMMYERSGSNWVLTQTLEGHIAGYGFGESLALNGDHLVIAEPDSVSGGRVVQFTRDSNGIWQEDGYIGLAGIHTDSQFGATMSMSEDRLYIASPNEQGAVGALDVFSLSNDDWVSPQEVPLPSPLPGDRAGAALAQNDDHLFVGIPGDGTTPGRVAVYPKQGGTLGTPVVLADPGVGLTGFGASIETSGSLLAIGYDDPAESPVHVFAFNGIDYQLIQSLPSRRGTGGSMFGSALAFGANTLLVGAPGEDASGESGSGRVHLYETELRYTVPECDMAMQNDRIQWIEDETPENSEWFAYAIAVDEGYAISGVPYEKFSFTYDGNTYNANNAGKAVIYERTGLREWTQVAQFRGNQVDTNPMPGINGDWMGISVDLEGDVAAAGGTQAYDEQTAVRSGSVQVYERTETGWARSTELFPSINGVSGAPLIFEFGSAVDLDSGGTKLAIGASNSRVPATGTGAAFVYERVGSQWIESNLLIHPQAQFGDHAGDSIAVEEDWVVVGSPDDRSGAGGAVHLFKRDALGSWSYHSTIQSPTNHPSSRFGISLELSRSDLGLTLVVGASNARSGFVNSVGAAFVFVLENNPQQWRLVQRLDPELSRTSTSYGTDVSVDHNTIAVGGPFIQNMAQGTHWTGGVEVYNLDSAQAQFQRRIVIRPDQAEWGTANGWGNSIGLSGGTVFLGTRYADGEPYNPVNTNRNWGAMLAYDIVCVPECPADMNADGLLDFFDVSLFLVAYQSMDPIADFNGDGLLDFFDVSAFLVAFSAGC